MRILVQKFGGSSVADEGFLRMLSIIEQSPKPLVVVVSAEKGATNRLLQEAQSQKLSSEATDALVAQGEIATVQKLCQALSERGCPCEGFWGSKIGITTDAFFGAANLRQIHPKKIFETLCAQKVAIVAGFQATTHEGQITTLGRGGSDLTALALASALNAYGCKIFTDVKGVFTANPQNVPRAQHLSALSFRDLERMAYLGSQVMQMRSISFAQRARQPFSIHSTWDPFGSCTQVLDSPLRRSTISADAQAYWIEIPKQSWIKSMQRGEFFLWARLQVDFMVEGRHAIRATLPIASLEALQKAIDFNPIGPVAKVSFVGPIEPEGMQRISEIVQSYPVLEAHANSGRYSLLVPAEMGNWLSCLLHHSCIEQSLSVQGNQLNSSGAFSCDKASFQSATA